MAPAAGSARSGSYRNEWLAQTEARQRHAGEDEIAPTIWRGPSGSPRKRTAVIIATIGIRLEYTDVRALPISRTAVYQIVYATHIAKIAA